MTALESDSGQRRRHSRRPLTIVTAGILLALLAASLAFTQQAHANTNDTAVKGKCKIDTYADAFYGGASSSYSGDFDLPAGQPDQVQTFGVTMDQLAANNQNDTISSFILECNTTMCNVGISPSDGVCGHLGISVTMFRDGGYRASCGVANAVGEDAITVLEGGGQTLVDVPNLLAEDRIVQCNDAASSIKFTVSRTP